MLQRRLLQRLLLALCVALAACSPTTSAARPGFGTVALHRHAKVGTVQFNLGTLGFDSNVFTTGTSASGSIFGATPTSVITASGLPAGLTINGAARTWAWDGTGSVSAGSFTLTETLGGYANSPHANSVGYSIIGSGAVAYDTTMGASVDANGFTSLPLHAGAHRYFVNPTGSDSNTCTQAQTAATPKATLAGGTSCIASGNGDQVLLAEGASFAEALPFVAAHVKDGFSATYPTVFWSYDPADPTNTAKYGRGDQRNARPKLTVIPGSISNGNGPLYLAFVGLEFNPGNVPNSLISMVADTDSSSTTAIKYILFENNVFRYTGISISEANGELFYGGPLIIRNNSFANMWTNAGDGRIGGVYAAGMDHVTVEDNVFYHNGWKSGASRDDDPHLGGATVFGHSYYLQTNTNNDIIRRNLSSDGEGDNGIVRGSGVLTENLFLDGPNSIGMGGGPNYDTDRPDGVTFTAAYNAILGDADVTTAHPLGWGITVSNGLVGSRAHHNLILRSRNPLSSSMLGFGNAANFNLRSYAEFDHNVMYLWVNPAGGGQVSQLGGGFFPLQNHATADYNIWDGTAGGTNTASASATFPNAYTAASLYTAMGYADKNAFINYALDHPEAHIQRNARALLFAGYGVAVDTDTTAPTLSLPVGSSSAPGTATIGATTNDSVGRLFYILTSTSTQPDRVQVRMGLDSTGTAVTYSGLAPVSASGANTIALTSIDPGTYYAQLVHEDTSSNKSNVVTSASFTVAAPGAAVWAAQNNWTLSNTNHTIERTSNSSPNFERPKATVAATGGTVLYTINTLGSGFDYVGLEDTTGLENNELGHSSHSFAWAKGGGVSVNGSVFAVYATWTTGDVLEFVKAGNSLSLYKQTGGAGGFVLQGTIDLDARYHTDTGDLANPSPLSGSAYPATSGSLGLKVTIDGSSW